MINRGSANVCRHRLGCPQARTRTHRSAASRSAMRRSLSRLRRGIEEKVMRDVARESTPLPPQVSTTGQTRSASENGAAKMSHGAARSQ